MIGEFTRRRSETFFASRKRDPTIVGGAESVLLVPVGVPSRAAALVVALISVALVLVVARLLLLLLLVGTLASALHLRVVATLLLMEK